MKNFILTALIIFFISSVLFAEKTNEVSLRYSYKDNLIRVVLDSDEHSIKNANSVATLSNIKIEFSERFELKKPKDFMFEILKKDRFLIINLKEIDDVKVYKLSSPARIVIDLKSAPKTLMANPQQALQKGQGVTAQQLGQKSQQETGQTPEKINKIKTVVIDAGHGGYDYGLLLQDSKEKDIALNLAKDLNGVLAKKGYKVFITRRADQSLSINDRINFANDKKPELFIGIHLSSSSKFVIYTSVINDLNTDVALKLYSLSSRQNRYIEKSRTISKSIGGFLKSEFKADILFREMPVPLLNSMDSLALAIECPLVKFYSYDQKMRERVAIAILKGITSYEQ
jgi:N-acetylmuramoyl-L-alanine amidase